MMVEKEVREALCTIANRMVKEEADYIETVVDCGNDTKYRIWVRVERVG